MRYRQFVVIGWLLVIVLASVWVAYSIRVSTDLSQFLPQDDTSDNRLLLKAIKSNPSTRVLMVSLRGGDTTELATANRLLATQLRSLSEVSQVSNGDLSVHRDYRSFLAEYHLLLNPLLTAERFSVAEMQKRLQRILEALQAPVPLIDKSLIPSDPIGSIEDVLRHWTRARNSHRVGGVWFSPDEKETLILVHTRAAGFDINRQDNLVAKVKSLHSELINPKITLILSGPGYYSAVYRELIKQDVMRLGIADSVFLALLLIVVYRSVVPWLLCLLPLISATLAGTVVVMWAFGEIHGITLAFGVTLIGVTIDYPIHYFTHIRKPHRARESMMQIWPTLRLGVLTTSIGFLSMALAGFSGLVQLGVFAITGLLVAAWSTKWLLPNSIPDTFFYQAPPKLLKFTETLVRVSSRMSYVIVLGVVVALVWLWAQPALTDNDLRKLQPLLKEHKQTDLHLRELTGTMDARFLGLVSGDSAEQLLQRSEQLIPELDRLVKEQIIEDYELAARYLPSQKTQQLRRALMPDPATLRANFALAVAGTPFKIDAFKPFFARVEAVRSGQILTHETVISSSLSLGLDSLLQQVDSTWLAPVLLRQVKDHARLKKWAATTQSPGFTLKDLTEETSNVVGRYSQEVIRWSSWGFVVIVLLLWVGLRSLGDLLRVIVPVGAAVVLTIALWNVAGVKLNIFHLVSLLLVIGMGIDYSLFFIRKVDDEDHRLDYLAVTICNITTVVAFGLLFFSFPPALQAIGGTVSAGAFFAFVAAASVAKKTRNLY